MGVPHGFTLACNQCGFINHIKSLLLRVRHMFLNPTDTKTARVAAIKYLLYTPGGELLDEFHRLPYMNASFILLNVGYPINCYWEKSRVFTSLHIHFTNLLSLCMGLISTVSTIFQM